jgi:large subunit ribosomal protein L15
MNLTDVTSASVKRERRRRVGRGDGSGKGKTCGRGHRGAKCRSGGMKGKLSYQGGNMPLFRTLPRRGFNNKRFRVPAGEVNLKDFSRLDATEITPEALKEAGLVSRKAKIVKVLGDGKLDKLLTVSAHKFSKSAVEKIEAAGGTVNIIR